jgi:hypothetical protein
MRIVQHYRTSFTLSEILLIFSPRSTKKKEEKKNTL